MLTTQAEQLNEMAQRVRNMQIAAAWHPEKRPISLGEVVVTIPHLASFSVDSPVGVQRYRVTARCVVDGELVEYQGESVINSWLCSLPPQVEATQADAIAMLVRNIILKRGRRPVDLGEVVF